MWGMHGWGWGLGMLLWLGITWGAVLLTAWMIFHHTSGPGHRLRH